MLPQFKYHPEPLSTGAIKEATEICCCCEQARGYIYVGPVYSLHDLYGKLCPWCISDGSARLRFNASFTARVGNGTQRWERVSKVIVEEVAYRTPSFVAWQEPEWWTHCGDAAAFKGHFGLIDVEHNRDRIESTLMNELAQAHPAEWDEFVLFECLTCGLYGGYRDLD